MGWFLNVAGLIKVPLLGEGNSQGYLQIDHEPFLLCRRIPFLADPVFTHLTSNRAMESDETEVTYIQI